MIFSGLHTVSDALIYTLLAGLEGIEISVSSLGNSSPVV